MICPNCSEEINDIRDHGQLEGRCSFQFFCSPKAERSEALQGCPPSANCCAEAGAEAPTNSLISSVVAPKEAVPAPQEICDIVEAMRQEDLRHSIPLMTDDTYILLAWKQWARSLSGKDIAETVMWVCANCIKSGTKLEAQFLEAYMRLKNTKRRTLPAQRERAIRRNGADEPHRPGE